MKADKILCRGSWSSIHGAGKEEHILSMITIENDQFSAEINRLGAELTTLTRKADGRQYIWNDTEGKYWGRHAPILFPSIGKSNNDQYTLAGDKFGMKQHGFARDYEFSSVTKEGTNSVTLTQHANGETEASYPFAYALSVTYTLTASGLEVSYTVANGDDKPMPFALGSHPGFALSQPLENYTVTVNGAKTPLTKFGIGPVPFRNGAVEPFTEAKGNTVPLSHELLDDGLIIINAPEATSATLAANDGSYSVELSLQDFPYLTLWSPEHKNAPFVCVEPFNGLPDQAADAPTDWFKKAGNTTLAANASATFGYTATLN
ncbi:aldose 1-epimerase [Lacticaseibacillus sharpeae JCM 1186 = DSM 20505]|uniref:Aldose 1-epimerase n=2 Tax=Lacticaseibacillus sharpeae TaxID=1626 RepID=A0A0R1ZL94_9LACO|nr:aldose 1-epimerase [Lacticaseibacillus sharpeae JCM 1186 = DSM 20505]